MGPTTFIKFYTNFYLNFIYSLFIKDFVSFSSKHYLSHMPQISLARIKRLESCQGCKGPNEIAN